MEFHENPLNGRRDTGKKVLCSPSRVPCITDQSRPNLCVFRSITTKHSNVLSHRGRVLDVEFQENPLNRRSDVADEVLWSPSKVHFITDRSRPNIQVL